MKPFKGVVIADHSGDYIIDTSKYHYYNVYDLTFTQFKNMCLSTDKVANKLIDELKRAQKRSRSSSNIWDLRAEKIFNFCGDLFVHPVELRFENLSTGGPNG